MLTSSQNVPILTNERNILATIPIYRSLNEKKPHSTLSEAPDSAILSSCHNRESQYLHLFSNPIRFTFVAPQEVHLTTRYRSPIVFAPFPKII